MHFAFFPVLLKQSDNYDFKQISKYKINDRSKRKEILELSRQPGKIQKLHSSITWLDDEVVGHSDRHEHPQTQRDICVQRLHERLRDVVGKQRRDVLDIRK